MAKQELMEEAKKASIESKNNYENQMVNCNLYIIPIPTDADEDMIRSKFSKYGPI